MDDSGDAAFPLPRLLLPRCGRCRERSPAWAQPLGGPGLGSPPAADWPVAHWPVAHWGPLFGRLLAAGLALLVTLGGIGRAGAQDVPFQPGQRVLVLGDSITQNGHYVALTEAYLWAAFRGELDVISIGLSGETVSGITEPVHPGTRPNLLDRLDRALELTQPDWVLACYGMNDGIYHPINDEISAAYRQGLSALAARVSSSGAKLILLTPPSFDGQAPAVQKNRQAAAADAPHGYSNPFADYDQTLVALGQIARSLVEEGAAERLIDIHAATDQYLQRVKAAVPDYSYGDGVHPPADGHLAMAVGLLSGLGFDSENAGQVLTHLTGLAAADATVTASEQQAAFHRNLLDRFGKRSAAYRHTVAAAASDQDAAELQAVDQAAAEQRAALQADMAQRRSQSPAAVYAPYVAAAKKRWKNEIQRLDDRNASEPAPENGILFIGSSSIRLWKTIDQDVAPYQAIERGYGGSSFSNVAVFAERIITPHQYDAMVVFVANDFLDRPTDPSLDEFELLARYVAEVSLKHNPQAPVLLVEITPTAARWSYWPLIQTANDRLRRIALMTPDIYFIETAEYYIDRNDQPVESYFIGDRLHQNEAGYAVWGALIKRRLDEVLAAGDGPLVPQAVRAAAENQAADSAPAVAP